MPTPVRVLHDSDPAEEIMNDVGWFIDGITPLGTEVLLVMYERVVRGEKKTSGGIIVPATQGKTAAEDKYQGKAGLVVKLGATAFQEDETHRWGGVVPKVGDWVLIDVRETYSFDVPIYTDPKLRLGSPIGERRFRQAHDVHVRILVDDPALFDAAW